MEIANLGIAHVAVITVIVYVIGMAVKNYNGIANKWIPVVCMITGGILGLFAMLTGMPDFPAHDILTSIAVGIVSGGMATCVDQAVKQLSGGTAVPTENITK